MTNQGAWQERDAESGGNAADDRFERPKLELAYSNNAALCEDVFKSLTVRTTCSQDDDLKIALVEQVVEADHSRRRKEHEVFPDNNFGLKLGMIDRTADERALVEDGISRAC